MIDAADCTVLFDFARPADRDAWRVQNDTVMGGNSRGRVEETGDTLVFSGDLVTRGGGFVQVQAPLPDGALAGMTHLRLVGSADGRPWRVRVTTDTRVPREAMRGPGDAPIDESGVDMDGPRVSFAAPIEGLDPGSGTTDPATASMSDAEASVRGRPVPGAVWDASRARVISLFLSDGRDAPFRIEVRRIEVCR